MPRAASIPAWTLTLFLNGASPQQPTSGGPLTSGGSGPPPPSSAGVFDVTSFGADPHGARDSTAAINAALSAAALAAEHRETLANEVVFPAGTYTISGQLNITSSLSSPGVAPRVRGVGMPIITQKDPTSDIFWGDRLWRVEISHLWLTGGRHQLHLGNNNTDQGNIFIHDMQFYEAAGAAIHTIGPSCMEADCPQPAFQGSFSTQLVVRDCKFHHCDQALINWCDWSTFETSWISTSCTMEDKAAIENHDKIFLRDIVGVPCNPNQKNATDRESSGRWIDNFSHRVGGGTVHATNVRFGGEDGGLTAVKNFAPYICQEVQSKLETEMCGRVNRSGPLPPSGMRGSGGSSIVLERCAFSGSYGHFAGAEVFLEEVPSQLIIRDSWMQAEVGSRSNVLVRVSPEIDLDGPYMTALPGKSLTAPIFDIGANNWQLNPTQAELPEQLRPYQLGRVEATAAPKHGLWRAGAVVWHRLPMGTSLAGPAAAPLGYLCVETGQPGVWQNFSKPLRVNALKSDDSESRGSRPEQPQTLLVEYRESPVFGVDSPRPRFSWSLSSTERDVSSAAYQIIVTSGNETVWDSGKVASEASHLVECGVALKPDSHHEWKVRWWASADGGSPSPFSAVALLHTGLFSVEDWRGAVPIRSANATSMSSDVTAADPGPCAQAKACRMVDTKELKNVDGYFGGEYSELHSAQTIPACIAACESDPACMQATWDPQHTSPTGFAKCATFKSIGPNYIPTVGVATGWIKLSGQFLQEENGHEPGVTCPVKGYPACCTWFETYADSTKHFVTDCDSYPKACGPAQRSCWPDFASQLPIKQVNASYLSGLRLGANYSCAMLNLHIPLVPPPPPAPPPPIRHAAEHLRKTFTVSGSVVRATAYVSGVGFVDAFLNGQAVAPHDKLNPGRTVFDMRQYYVAYDVTALLKSNAKNAVGLWLGGGWQSMIHDDLGPVAFHTPAARLLLSITTSDGKTQRVRTDLSWKGSRDGPIRDNDIYGGEVYDARMEMDGWSTASFDDSSWKAVQKNDEFQGRYKLSWQPMAPIRALELMRPLSITPILLADQNVTVYVAKFPQNAAGWSRLTVKDCPAGTNISMFFSEVLCGPQDVCSGPLPGEGLPGTVDQRGLSPHQPLDPPSKRNQYVCKGGGTEVYEPRFT